MRLTAADKRLLARATCHPWRDDGGPSIYEFLANPEYDPAKFGITRRILLEDPSQLAVFGAISVREEWNSYARLRRDRDPAALWHTCLWAFAVNDQFAVRHYLQNLPQTCPKGCDGGIPWYPQLYDLFVALAHKDAALIDSALGKLSTSSQIPKHDVAMASVMIAIARREPEQFADSLEELGQSLRRIRLIDPHYKLIDVIGHGFWELACSIDPQIVSTWDIERDLPWDRGLHQWCRGGRNPLDSIDRSRVKGDSAMYIDLSPLR